MENFNQINDADWGEWVPSKDQIFKKGDLFILGIHGPVKIAHYLVYKVMGEPDEFGHTPLACWNTNQKDWEYDHSWNMQSDTTAIRRWYLQLRGAKLPAIKSRECPCGIFRGDCDYHKD